MEFEFRYGRRIEQRHGNNPLVDELCGQHASSSDFGKRSWSWSFSRKSTKAFYPEQARGSIEPRLRCACHAAPSSPDAEIDRPCAARPKSLPRSRSPNGWASVNEARLRSFRLPSRFCTNGTNHGTNPQSPRIASKRASATWSALALASALPRRSSTAAPRIPRSAAGRS